MVLRRGVGMIEKSAEMGSFHWRLKHLSLARSKDHSYALTNAEIYNILSHEVI